MRRFLPSPLESTDISQLCWAAQGISSEQGLRTSPSAGATYPLELMVVAANVDPLNPGIYRYIVSTHALEAVLEGDVRDVLSRAGFGQQALLRAPATLAISAVYERTTARYGERGIRYVNMEAGHAAQNICLQALALELGTVLIGAFNDREVKRLLLLDPPEVPLYLIPVGKPLGAD